jgi:hypothetical protein
MMSYATGDSIELMSVNLTLPIDRVFENIRFDSELEA